MQICYCSRDGKRNIILMWWFELWCQGCSYDQYSFCLVFEDSTCLDSYYVLIVEKEIILEVKNSDFLLLCSRMQIKCFMYCRRGISAFIHILFLSTHLSGWFLLLPEFSVFLKSFNIFCLMWPFLVLYYNLHVLCYLFRQDFFSSIIGIMGLFIHGLILIQARICMPFILLVQKDCW